MTPRENFLQMMRGEAPERVPFAATFTPPVVDLIRAKTGHDDPATALGTDFIDLYFHPSQHPDRWREAYTRIGFSIPPDAEVTPAGRMFRQPQRETLGAAWHLREMLHPLEGVQTVRELESLPWPDVADPVHYAGLPQTVAGCHERGLAFVANLECTVFESAWYLRGMDNLFMDLLEENPVGEWLLEWFTRRSEQAAAAFTRAGADCIGLGDDVGTQRGMMMSATLWRQHFKPRLARVIRTIRATETDKVWIRYHSDGDIRDIIPDLIEIGVDILNPVQPECMPVADTVRTYSGQMAFWGMIGTQTTMPFGSPADVRTAVGECLKLASEGARIVIAPTHVLEPDVSWENISALADAAQSARLH